MTTVQKQRLDLRDMKAIKGGAAGVGVSLGGGNGVSLGLGNGGLSLGGALGSIGLGASVNKS
jgi:hypothetical protein